MSLDEFKITKMLEKLVITRHGDVFSFKQIFKDDELDMAMIRAGISARDPLLNMHVCLRDKEPEEHEE